MSQAPDHDDQDGRTTSRATQSPSADRARISSPARSRAVRTSPSRSTKIPDARRVPPGLSSRRDRRPARPAPRRSGWPGRRRRPVRRSAGCPREPEAAAPGRSGGRWRPSPRLRSGRCPRPRPSPRPVATRRSPGSRSRSRHPGRGSRPGIPRSARSSRAARHRRVVGWSPVPKAIPGSRASTTSPGRRRCRRQVGRTTNRRPIRMDREVRLPGLGPVRLVHQPRPELADRPQPEGLQVPERLVHDRRRALGRGPIAGRQVGADDRRPGRIDPCPEALVGQLEAGLHGRPAGRRAAEDLADGLDRLDVRLDGKLQPRAVPASTRPRPGSPAAARPQPQPSASSNRSSFSRTRRARSPISPAASAYALSASRCRLRELGRDD